MNYIAVIGHTVEIRDAKGKVLWSCKAMTMAEARKFLALIRAANPNLKVIGPAPDEALRSAIKGAIRDDGSQ